MNTLRVYFLLFLLLNLCGRSFGQDGDEPAKLELGGYLKFLGSFNHTNTDFVPPLLEGLVPASTEDFQFHNRFDLKYYASEGITFGVGMRNRLMWGYQVRQGEPFFKVLNNDPGLVDLSFLYWQSEDVILHTIFDRAWAQWVSKKWIVRLGRQRINWGVNTVWNPNDLFNQYNYFDFDYEERPGSDALRVQYFPDFSSTLEAAFSPARELAQSVGALMYKFNRWSYDFQLLGGYYRQDAVMGLGWAGNIGGAGFKGEASYYTPLTNETEAALVASVSADYIFGDGTYVQLSYLFNSPAQGEPNLLDFASLTSGQVLSARNIFIFRHTIFSAVNFEFTPLFTGSFATMVTPYFNNLILFPSLNYSLAENLDLLFATQFFATENLLRNDEFDWLALAMFTRLKWSF